MKSKDKKNQFKTFLFWSKNHCDFLGFLLAIALSGCSNDSKSSSADLFETGIYNYQITDNENPELCSEILKIDNTEMGCFTVVDGNLKIDQAFLDGYSLMQIP